MEWPAVWQRVCASNFPGPELHCSISNSVPCLPNQNNTIEEEIKERLIAGNRAYSANQKMFKSKLLSRESKLKL